MSIMISTLISTFIFSLLSRVVEREKKRVASIIFICVASIILIIPSAFRNNIGDTYVYISSFKKMGTMNLIEVVKEFGDVGYYIFTYLLYKISSNPQIMIFATATITQICYIKFFYKYRSLLELQIFMYITAGAFFVSMNGIRQSLAAAIIVLATKYIINKDFKKFLLVIILASSIHQSALIMIPIYFIVLQKPGSKRIFIMIGLSLIGVVLFNQLMPYLFKILQGSNYEHYERVFKEGTEQGANILRVIIAFVPIMLAYIKKDEIKELKGANIFVNMSVINFIFMIFSLRTWIFARFTIYFNLYNFILLPYLIYKWKNKKEKRLLYFLFIICYLFFFLVEQANAERIRIFFDLNDYFYRVI